MEYDYLHEVEQVELRSPNSRSLSELPTTFKQLGFTIHDDVLCLDRIGKVPPWQHCSIAEVEVQRNGEEVFGFDEGDWDLIRLKYFFATVPYELAERFIAAALAISRNLLLPVRYDSSEVDEAFLRQQFAKVRADLLAETGEDAGSEGLAILIQSRYPRR